MSRPGGEGMRLAFLSTSTMAVLVAFSWLACNRTLDFSSDGGGTGGAPGFQSGGMGVIATGGDDGGVVSTGGVIGSGGLGATGGAGTGGAVMTGGARAGGAMASGGRATGGAAPTGGAGGARGTGGFTGACTTNADCGLPGLRCDVAGSRTCVGCLINNDCIQQNAGLPICDTTVHRCVRCLVGTDCPSGQTCLVHYCVQNCTVDTECSSMKCEENLWCSACETGDRLCPAGGPQVCFDAAHTCVECLNNTQCVAPRPFCETATSRCLQCTTHAQCAALDPAMPICDLTAGVCRAAP